MRTELCMNIIAPKYQCAELCFNYVRMLITPNLSFESESYDSHVIVRAKARLFKSRAMRFRDRSS